MLTRQQIKENAKAGFKAAYWPSVGSLVLVMLIMTGAGLLNFIPMLGLAAVIVLLPLGVGLAGYFLGVYRRQGDSRVGKVFNIAFSQNYGRKLGGMAYMLLFIWLWCLIAVVPMLIGMVATGVTAAVSINSHAQLAGPLVTGVIITVVLTIAGMIPAIIKEIAYSMTPFILADCPNVPATNAIKLSMRMTKGYKGEIFVMVLSFIGWWLLSGLTLGLLNIFWTGPYMETSMAGLYDELKRRALEHGTVTQAEFDDGWVPQPQGYQPPQGYQQPPQGYQQPPQTPEQPQ